VLRFVLRRLLLMIPVLFGLSVLLFAWVRALPGDPARALLGEKATPQSIAAVNAQYGFDKPLLQQYLLYTGQLLRGNFGTSPRTGEPVLGTFFERFPATVELALAALIFAVVIGIPLGYLAAKRAGGPLDLLTVGSSLVGVVIPVFVLAYLLKVVFAIGLPGPLHVLAVLPSSGRQTATIDATHITNFYVLDGVLTREWDAAWDAILHLVLPAVALGTIPLAVIVRITRASVLDVLDSDFVRTANSKGLAPGTIRGRHVLRNALLPVSTTIGLQVGLLLAGAVLTEKVFVWGGIGTLLADAITLKDYPRLQALLLLGALVYVLVNLLVDLSYAIIDPRVRLT
jgi:peptide/nickel transport system permease protein